MSVYAQARQWNPILVRMMAGFLYFSSLFPGSTHSQLRELRFEHLRNQPGLHSRSIYSILLDRQGFLRFGTDNGIARYDGFLFTTVAPPFREELGPGQNLIYDCIETDDGVLWCATPGGGVLRYDPLHDSLARFTSRSASLASDLAYAVCQDGFGTLWVGSTGGLDTLDHRAGVFRHVFQDSPRGPVPFDVKATAVREWPQNSGIIWIGTWGKGLVRHRRPQNDWTTWEEPAANDPQSADGFIRTVFMSSRNRLWFGTEHGRLLYVDPETGSSGQLSFAREGLPAAGAIKDIRETPEGLLLVSTLSTGLFLLDPATGSSRQWSVSPRNNQSISHNDVRCTFVGPGGVIWVGTRDGIDKANPVRGLFTSYQNDPDNDQGLSDNMVYGMCEDRTGALWITTAQGGLNRFQRSTGRWTHFTHRPDSRGTLATDQLSSVYEDRAGTLWVGGRRGWLHRFRPSSGSFDRWLIPRAPFDPPGTSVHCIRQDRDGRYWLGTTHGLVLFDPGTGKATQAGDLFPAAAAIKGPVHALLEDRSGHLWVASLSSGLHQIDVRNRTCVTFSESRYDSVKMRHLSVTSLMEDRTGDLWVGTAGGGVHRYDSRTGKFAEFTAGDGLSNGMIYMILEDTRGRVWASTSRGLSVYDPASGRWSTFDVSDGLPADEFNTGGAVRCADGTLGFGGVNGFTMIRADTLYPNTYVPPVRLISLSVGGRPYTSSIGVSHLTSAVFPSSEEAIAFELAVLDYRHPDRNLYAYKLEGIDRDWIQAGNRRYVAYSNLAPGTYVFRARGSNDSGIWSSREFMLTLVIERRFWQTWWFRGLVVLALLGAAYWFYWYRMSKILEVQRVRLRIADDLHDDIGSELSGIALESDLIARQLPSGAQGRLLALGQTVRKAADDLRDVVWFVNPDRDRFTDLLARMQSVAAKLLAGHNYILDLPVSPPPVPLGMEFRRHVLMMFKEILNNVVRHAGATELHVQVEMDGKRLRLYVRDNGRGFDTRQEFTGRGLDSLRSRASAIGAVFSLESSPGKGTTVRLEADITRSDD